MSTSLQAYADAALSSAIYNPNIIQRSDGGSGPTDLVLHLGSIVPGKKIQAQSNPGIDNIVLRIFDATPGDGQPPSSIKLALSAAGLAAAVPGASLSLGNEIITGVGNAVAVHVRVEAGDLPSGTFGNLSLQPNELVETNA